MSNNYQVLARRLRPQLFADVFGQNHIVKSLQNSLRNNNFAAAVIFSGSRGLGKTTMARLVAKYLNCLDKNIEKCEPCNACSICQEFSEGRFADFIEVDAATRTHLESTKQLLESVKYPPVSGVAKIFLIDEVHMLSEHSFNALLKTLEEPPKDIYFIFATTELEKIPQTILSRCLHFQLRTASAKSIAEFLNAALTNEGITSETGGIDQIAQSAHGSLRDALTLSEQALAFGDGSILEKDVSALLGLVERDTIRQLIKAVLEKSGKQAMDFVETMVANNVNAQAVIHSCAQYLQQLSRAKIVQDVETSDSETALLAETKAETLQLLYQICITTLRDLPHLHNQIMSIEMMILRMLAFVPVKVSGDFTAKPSQPEDREKTEQPLSEEQKKKIIAQPTQPTPVANLDSEQPQAHSTQPNSELMTAIDHHQEDANLSVPSKNSDQFEQLQNAITAAGISELGQLVQSSVKSRNSTSSNQ